MTASIMTETLQLAQPPCDIRLTTEQEMTREQSAYERGRRDAENALNQLLLDQRLELVEALQNTLVSLRRAMPQVIEDSRQQLVSLALEVAYKLTTGIPVSAEMVEATVRDALAHAGQATECTVYLHPDDLKLLQQLEATALPLNGANDAVKFESSAEVTRGGCLVKTKFGVIDARRETKLEQLQKALLS
jgi:flagellar assembly protein FliH